MDETSIQDLIYSDPVEEILNQRDFDDIDDQYDDQSFGTLLDSSNDF